MTGAMATTKTGIASLPPELQTALSKIDDSIDRLSAAFGIQVAAVQRIPAIEQNLEVFKVAVDGRLGRIEDRLEEVETQPPHPCIQATQVELLKNRAQERDKNRSRFLGGVLGLVAIVVTTLGSTIWFLASLNQDVIHERALRSSQYSTLSEKIEKLPTRINANDNGHDRDWFSLLDGESRRQVCLSVPPSEQPPAMAARCRGAP